MTKMTKIASEAVMRSLSLLNVEILDGLLLYKCENIQTKIRFLQKIKEERKNIYRRGEPLDQQTHLKQADNDRRRRYSTVNGIFAQYTQSQSTNVKQEEGKVLEQKIPLEKVAQRAGDHRSYGKRQKTSQEYMIPSMEINHISYYSITPESPDLLQMTGWITPKEPTKTGASSFEDRYHVM
ncbi:uncharacterized protein EAE97_005287 [Botrytis byssoidea]|uniref:Uncharacterized protein n=1 Tax=Botrytis byssoidea TaxID=139641 RepID=A0A9P5LV43_9HELO|nr:uncharacterized protein EAE97_005287 [Botrytis byssoidea]KAF7944654.1 hypothetical protein EAE97_005287 [Botrytis byssoidea]